VRSQTDAELLQDTGADPAAFGEFYDRYEAPVVAYFARRVRDPELAADLTAEVFAAALIAAPRYRAVQPTAAGWLFTIAHNTLAKSVRRERVDAFARLRLEIRDAVTLGDDELERVEALASDAGQLEDLLDRLPAAQADAVIARVLEEQSYHDIASRLQTSELVIRKRVSRGLVTLRQELEKEPRT
jgi:RNA polymerase sigma factor (sigma-70 family)